MTTVERTRDGAIRDLIGSAKRVLNVVLAPGELATALRDAGNVVVEVSLDRVAGHVPTLEPFDAVVFDDGLQNRGDRAQLVSSSRALLRDGGFVVLVVTASAAVGSRPAPRESLTRMVAECGLIPMKIVPVRATLDEASADVVAFVVRAVQRSESGVRRDTSPDQLLIARLAEVEQHYRNALAQAEASRIDRDAMQRQLETLRADRVEELEAAADARAEIARLQRIVDGAASSAGAVSAARKQEALLEETSLRLAAVQADRDRIRALLGRPDTASVVRVEPSADSELLRRGDVLEHLLSIERTSRTDVVEACDRIAELARSRLDAAAELTRLRMHSECVDLELRLARATRRRAPLPGSFGSGSPLSAEVVAARLDARPGVRMLPSAPPRRNAFALRRLRRLFRST